MRTDLADPKEVIVAKYRNATGLTDLLPEGLRYWHHTKQLLEKIANSFGYRQVLLPSIDPLSVYRDAFGETGVAWTFECGISDEDEHYVLRAHPRLGMLRSYIENGLSAWPPPVRVFYETDVIKKHAGKMSHHRYWCLDCLGARDITTASSLVVMLQSIGKELHSKHSRVVLYSSGCATCRPPYNKLFSSYAKARSSELCPACVDNPTLMNLIACDIDTASNVILEAPSLLDHLCPSCHSQLATMLEASDDLGIEYEVDPRLISADPEAEQTTFALRLQDESRPAIMGYHFGALVSRLSPEPMTALGIIVDMQQLSDQLETLHVTLPDDTSVQVFVAQLGAQAKNRCVPLLQQLYGAGFFPVTASESESITQQLQVAARLNARITLIIGQKEAMNGHVIMRDMASGLQDNVFMDDLIPALQERFAVAI